MHLLCDVQTAAFSIATTRLGFVIVVVGVEVLVNDFRFLAGGGRRPHTCLRATGQLRHAYESGTAHPLPVVPETTTIQL